MAVTSEEAVKFRLLFAVMMRLVKCCCFEVDVRVGEAVLLHALQFVVSCDDVIITSSSLFVGESSEIIKSNI